MTGLLILAIYMIGFVVALRRSIPRMLARLDRTVEQFRYEDSRERIRRDERFLYLGGALLIAVFWPFALIGITFWRVVTAGVDIRTPAEISEAEREELENLRRMAREYDLPTGEHRHRASCHGARGELQCEWPAS